MVTKVIIIKNKKEVLYLNAYIMNIVLKMVIYIILYSNVLFYYKNYSVI